MKYCPQCKMTRKYELLKLNLEEGIPAWRVSPIPAVSPPGTNRLITTHTQVDKDRPWDPRDIVLMG